MRWRSRAPGSRPVRSRCSSPPLPTQTAGAEPPVIGVDLVLGPRSALAPGCLGLRRLAVAAGLLPGVATGLAAFAARTAVMAVVVTAVGILLRGCGRAHHAHGPDPQPVDRADPDAPLCS